MLDRGQTAAGGGGGQPADEKLVDLDRLWAIILRQARVIAFCVGFGLVAAIVYILLSPDTYRASSEILIDKNLEEVVGEVTPTNRAVDLESEILNQIEVLRSGRIARVVAESEKLATDPDFLNPPPSPVARIREFVLSPVIALFGGRPRAAEEADDVSLDAVAASLARDVEVQRVGRSSVVRVEYESHTPELAYRITRAYANAFVRDRLNADLDATRQAGDWLQQRLSEISQAQRQASLEVEKYRAQAKLPVAEDKSLSNQRLEALTGQLVLAQNEAARIQALSDQLQKVVEAGPDAAAANADLLTDPGANNADLVALKTRYSSLQRRVEEITASFGADHPQLEVLRRELASISGELFGQLKFLNEHYRSELKVAQSHVAGLRADVESEGQRAAESSQSQVELNTLQQRSAALDVLYNTFLARYEESLQQQSFPVPTLRVITEATLPATPSGPRSLVILAGGLLLGGVLGLGFGAFNEMRERGFRLGSQVTRETGLRFIGYLPMVGVPASPATPEPSTGAAKAGPSPAPQVHKAIRSQITGQRASSATSTLLETLKAARILLRGRYPGEGTVVGVVSILPGEGKTTYSVALAEALAFEGNRTLLIDADLRRSTASKLLADGVEAAGDPKSVNNWRTFVRRDVETGLSVLPAAASASQSSRGDILTKPAMQLLLKEARHAFDYVVLDLPPLGPVADALAIMPWTDGFILVAEWGTTPRSLVRAALEREPQLNEEILGVVLNKVDLARLARYSEPGAAERYVGAYSAYYAPPPAPDTEAAARAP